MKPRTLLGLLFVVPCVMLVCAVALLAEETHTCPSGQVRLHVHDLWSRRAQIGRRSAAIARPAALDPRSAPDAAAHNPASSCA